MATTEAQRAAQKRYRDTHPPTSEDKAKRAAYMRDWVARNPHKVKEYNVKRYGLTLEEFLAMREEQGQACAICRRLFEDNQSMRAHVDHNHETGKVRGLVCPRCNYILGRVNRDVDLLEAALAYLKAK